MNVKFHGNHPTAVETFHSKTQNVNLMVALKQKSVRRRDLGIINPSKNSPQSILQILRYLSLSQHDSWPGDGQAERPTSLSFWVIKYFELEFMIEKTLFPALYCEISFNSIIGKSNYPLSCKNHCKYNWIILLAGSIIQSKDLNVQQHWLSLQLPPSS